MPNLEWDISPLQQIEELRKTLRAKRIKSDDVSSPDFSDTVSRREDTTSAVLDIILQNEPESGPGELRTEDGGSTRERLPFSWRFDNVIDRKLLLENKSVIISTDGNELIKYIFVKVSTFKDVSTGEYWLKFVNQSTGEMLFWNGTFTRVSKFWYSHNRIAVRKWRIENGTTGYNTDYTFLDIMSDKNGNPRISE